jgi:hypothetical protein
VLTWADAQLAAMKKHNAPTSAHSAWCENFLINFPFTDKPTAKLEQLEFYCANMLIVKQLPAQSRP